MHPPQKEVALLTATLRGPSDPCSATPSKDLDVGRVVHGLQRSMLLKAKTRTDTSWIDLDTDKLAGRDFPRDFYVLGLIFWHVIGMAMTKTFPLVTNGCE